MVVGQTVLFTVTATGKTPLRYQLRKKQREYLGRDQGELDHSGNDVWRLRRAHLVVVSNSAGSVTSENAVLNVR